MDEVETPTLLKTMGAAQIDAYIDHHRGNERKRIATWIRAKSEETERLLKTAADRCEGEQAAWNRLFAIKMRVVMAVIAEMVERDHMTLMGGAEG